LSRNGRQLAGAGPTIRGIGARALDQWMEFLPNPAAAFEKLIKPGPLDDASERSESDLFKQRRFLTDGIAAVVQQMMVQVDLNRADVGAGAAKRAAGGERPPVVDAA